MRDNLWLWFYPDVHVQSLVCSYSLWNVNRVNRKHRILFPVALFLPAGFHVSSFMNNNTWTEIKVMVTLLQSLLLLNIYSGLHGKPWLSSSLTHEHQETFRSSHVGRWTTWMEMISEPVCSGCDGPLIQDQSEPPLWRTSCMGPEFLHEDGHVPVLVVLLNFWSRYVL